MNSVGSTKTTYATIGWTQASGEKHRYYAMASALPGTSALISKLGGKGGRDVLVKTG